MAFRNITEEMVREALKNPDETGIGYKNKTLAYKTFAGKRIKVVYTKENSNFVIVSVIWE